MENRSLLDSNLIQTLKGLTEDFRYWNKNIFKNKEDTIMKIDKENAKPSHLVSRKRLKSLENDLETLNKIENIYWLENSRDKIFKEHDKCTRYFHVVASNRKRNSSIYSLRDESGLWIEKKDQLDNILRNHFSKISTSLGGQINDVFNNIISEVITEEENQALVKMPDVEEIKNVLCSMNPWESPGPAGYPPGFFRPIGTWLNQMVH